VGVFRGVVDKHEKSGIKPDFFVLSFKTFFLNQTKFAELRNFLRETYLMYDDREKFRSDKEIGGF